MNNSVSGTSYPEQSQLSAISFQLYHEQQAASYQLQAMNIFYHGDHGDHSGIPFFRASSVMCLAPAYLVNWLAG